MIPDLLLVVSEYVQDVSIGSTVAEVDRSTSQPQF